MEHGRDGAVLRGVGLPGGRAPAQSRLAAAAILLGAALCASCSQGGDGDPAGPDGPAIQLSPGAVTFTATVGGPDPPAQSVAVESDVAQLVASVTYRAGQPAGWLTATVEGAGLHLHATTGALSPGTYSAGVVLASVTPPVVASGTLIVTVSVVSGAAGPTIQLSTASVGFSASVGEADPTPMTVGVTNGGGGTLDGLEVSATYPTGQPGGWLSAEFDRTTAPATLTLTATTGALAVGSYDAVVRVTSTAAVVGDSPRTISVTLDVVEAPVLALSVTSVTFPATAGGQDPAQQAVGVTNGGSGTISGLAATVSYPADQPTGWLSAVLSGTVAPTTLTLTARSQGLSAGTYTATVDVGSTAPGVPVAPRQLAVVLTVEFTSYASDFEGPDCLSDWTVGGRRLYGPNAADCVTRHGGTMGHLYKYSFTEITLAPNVGRVPMSARPTFDFEMEVRVVPSVGGMPTFYAMAGAQFNFYDARDEQMGMVRYVAATTQHPFDQGASDPTVGTVPLAADSLQAYSLRTAEILSHIQIDESAIHSVELVFLAYSSHTNADVAEVWIDDVAITRTTQP